MNGKNVKNRFYLYIAIYMSLLYTCICQWNALPTIATALFLINFISTNFQSASHRKVKFSAVRRHRK